MPITTISSTSTSSLPLTTSSLNGLPNGCLDAFRQAALNAHNLYRSKHSADPLTEDTNLDSSAQSYATKLGITNDFKHSGLANVGENLYASYTSVSLSVSMCSSELIFK